MFKKTILKMLISIETRVKKMSKQIDDLVVDFSKAFADLSAALDNIAADETRLAQQIDALFKQIADLIATGGTLGAEDLEKLSVLRNTAVAMAAKTQQIADSQPDPVAPPV